MRVSETVHRRFPVRGLMWARSRRYTPIWEGRCGWKRDQDQLRPPLLMRLVLCPALPAQASSVRRHRQRERVRRIPRAVLTARFSVVSRIKGCRLSTGQSLVTNRCFSAFTCASGGQVTQSLTLALTSVSKSSHQWWCML